MYIYIWGCSLTKVLEITVFPSWRKALESVKSVVFWVLPDVFLVNFAQRDALVCLPALPFVSLQHCRGCCWYYINQQQKIIFVPSRSCGSPLNSGEPDSTPFGLTFRALSGSGPSGGSAQGWCWQLMWQRGGSLGGGSENVLQRKPGWLPSHPSLLGDPCCRQVMELSFSHLKNAAGWERRWKLVTG